MSALPDDAAWAFGSGWVRLVTDQLEQHSKLLGSVDERLKKVESAIAENTRALDEVKGTLDRLVSAVQALGGGPGQPGTPGTP